ncbi:hypothetical protein D3C87_1320420 [compost metagenome]
MREQQVLLVFRGLGDLLNRSKVGMSGLTCAQHHRLQRQPIDPLEVRLHGLQEARLLRLARSINDVFDTGQQPIIDRCADVFLHGPMGDVS